MLGLQAPGLSPTLEFADGVEWGQPELIQQSIEGQSSNFADRIRGSALDDSIYGLRGDDLLLGELGDDTYYFYAGDGNDVIEDTGGIDQLVLTGYRAADLRVSLLSLGSSDLLLRFVDAANSIIIRGAAIESVMFGDGSTIDGARIAGAGAVGRDRWR